MATTLSTRSSPSSRAPSDALLDDSGIRTRREGETPDSERIFAYEAAGATSVGRRRKKNEDCFVVSPTGALYAVADGMGGHAAGEIASTIAIKALTTFLEDTVRDPDKTWPFPLERARSLDENRLVAAVRHANLCIYEAASRDMGRRGMGTTVVALHASPTSLVVAHVGDSRAYRLRDDTLKAITEDHSLFAMLEKSRAASMVDALGRAQLGVSEGKNVLLRALGAEPSVAVDSQRIEVCAGDVYLLCSDGLHGCVEDDAIREILRGEHDLARAGQALVDAANDEGGPDNITVVLVRCANECRAPR
jgi:PPM family protein phosphatase